MRKLYQAMKPPLSSFTTDDEVQDVALDGFSEDTGDNMSQADATPGEPLQEHASTFNNDNHKRQWWCRLVKSTFSHATDSEH